jgi:Spy/CpxP family protein refolding chaperone
MKGAMKNYPAHRLTAIALVCAATVLLWTGVDVGSAQAGGIHEMASPNGVAPKLELTAAQRSAIYQAVSQDKGKVAPSRFPTNTSLPRGRKAACCFRGDRVL